LARGVAVVILQSVAGLLVFVLIAWLLSEKRWQVNIRDVLVGIGLQVGLAVLLLKVSLFQDLFLSLNRAILSLEESTRAGTSMVFGYLGGGPLPFEETFPEATFILAFRALPLLLVISALSSLLFYWKVLPAVVKAFSRLLEKSMNLGGAAGLGVAANVFMGMVEAPLVVRPYVKNMTRSELFTVMTSGMATIAGTVMVLYASLLSSVPNIMGHILTASIISAPAAITVAKIMIPETETVTAGRITPPEEAHSPMDALTRGTVQGVGLLINVIAMLIVLVAMVHLVNLMLGWLPLWGSEPITLQRVLGAFMAPVVWLIGVPWSEAHLAGQLMGTKTVLNELIAFIDMSRLPEGSLSPRTSIILIYALCGFANPGSLGIMIGGMGTIAPDRRSEIAALGFKTIAAGTLAKCMTGAIVAILL
jgi:CNT family concentrative nucleoside transporter